MGKFDDGTLYQPGGTGLIKFSEQVFWNLQGDKQRADSYRGAALQLKASLDAGNAKGVEQCSVQRKYDDGTVIDVRKAYNFYYVTIYCDTKIIKSSVVKRNKIESSEVNVQYTSNYILFYKEGGITKHKIVNISDDGIKSRNVDLSSYFTGECSTVPSIYKRMKIKIDGAYQDIELIGVPFSLEGSTFAYTNEPYLAKNINSQNIKFYAIDKNSKSITDVFSYNTFSGECTLPEDGGLYDKGRGLLSWNHDEEYIYVCSMEDFWNLRIKIYRLTYRNGYINSEIVKNEKLNLYEEFYGVESISVGNDGYLYILLSVRNGLAGRSIYKIKMFTDEKIEIYRGVVETQDELINISYGPFFLYQVTPDDKLNGFGVDACYYNSVHRIYNDLKHSTDTIEITNNESFGDRVLAKSVYIERQGISFGYPYYTTTEGGYIFEHRYLHEDDYGGIGHAAYSLKLLQTDGHGGLVFSKYKNPLFFYDYKYQYIYEYFNVDKDEYIYNSNIKTYLCSPSSTASDGESEPIDDAIFTFEEAEDNEYFTTKDFLQLKFDKYGYLYPCANIVTKDDSLQVAMYAGNNAEKITVKNVFMYRNDEECTDLFFETVGIEKKDFLGIMYASDSLCEMLKLFI